MTKRQQRILFVWSSAEYSTFDVARGYRAALERRAKDFSVRDYRLYARIRYHAKALGEKRAENLNLLTRIASENVVVEAMKQRADLVFIISGTALHPDSVWYLRRAGIRTAVLFTESPYNDREQRRFHAVYPEMDCFTNEKTSAVDGWQYLPHAYDPAVHFPPDPMPSQTCDVLLVGTLWQSRIELLETVDWSGIDLRLAGTWVSHDDDKATERKRLDSPVWKFFSSGCIKNPEAVKLYPTSRICLNPHRVDKEAESLNPRAYELAACKSFQLSDYRSELHDVFGKNGSCSVATYKPETLEESIRYWLAHESERRELAEESWRAVQPHTFDARLESLFNMLG